VKTVVAAIVRLSASIVIPSAEALIVAIIAPVPPAETKGVKFN
jgi:hypothetical protein